MFPRDVLFVSRIDNLSRRRFGLRRKNKTIRE